MFFLLHRQRFIEIADGVADTIQLLRKRIYDFFKGKGNFFGGDGLRCGTKIERSCSERHGDERRGGRDQPFGKSRRHASVVSRNRTGAQRIR